ncbi:MAG: hypothetical protein ACRDRH_18995 [Pseudonocardia sp.]
MKAKNATRGHGKSTPRDRCHVYWIGGGSGSGKSTIARRLAVANDLQVYDTDRVMPEHAARLTAEEAPMLAIFKGMDMDKRWALRTPREMLETFHWFQGEGFNLILDDVAQLLAEPPAIVEGFRLLPHLVAPHLGERARGVWLLPTPEFRRAAIESRGTLWDIPNKTGDPERALKNLLERDHMFTERLSSETTRLALPVIHVEKGMTEDELTDQVSDLFGL